MSKPRILIRPTKFLVLWTFIIKFVSFNFFGSTHLFKEPIHHIN